MKDNQTGSTASHIKLVSTIKEDLMACHASDVKEKCIFIEKGHGFQHSYVCTLPNFVESD